jgi:hypothetical protein
MVFFGNALCQGPMVWRGPVIDNNAFDVVVTLVDDGKNGLFEVVGVIKVGDDHRNGRSVPSSPIQARFAAFLMSGEIADRRAGASRCGSIH